MTCLYATTLLVYPNKNSVCSFIYLQREELHDFSYSLAVLWTHPNITLRMNFILINFILLFIFCCFFKYTCSMSVNFLFFSKLINILFVCRTTVYVFAQWVCSQSIIYFQVIFFQYSCADI